MTVITKSEDLACKHVLACRIAESIGRAQVVHVSKEEFMQWLLKEEAQPSPAKRWRRAEEWPSQTSADRMPRQQPSDLSAARRGGAWSGTEIT
eukprot:CAMPEP_0202831108 /NCGR_PEP_ID=MMETSP1389-20130828/16616_1 /ASSEMBLY_ACC=CAM_ASM_000865 /TAXON_ID=302021 /ORGANISM="Rhodomonas sp., Strain CCMP768" /LENGTH=92 /DNA_ID=CAMNT_0049504805 /DNA_START=96 /DNA_END=372 /DNA_ORIENTATION=+